MRMPLPFLTLSVLILLCAAAPVGASEFDKKTLVTFHEAIEIPGMVLPAGHYVMKRADRSLPDVVQFASSNENHVYATVFALPTYRQTPTDKVVITTEERSANQPEAIKKWFYPGDTIGAEFVYPKGRERLVAMNTSSSAPPVFKEPEETTSAPMTPKPSAEATTPETHESEAPEPALLAQSSSSPQTSSPAANAAPSATNNSQSSTAPQQSDDQKQLPHTATDLPLLGFFGALFTFAGWTIRRASQRSS
jgi:hypothetical protein